MAYDCAQFSSFLFRRTPDFDTELVKDRFPMSYVYSGMYETAPWPSFTGTTHTWDRVHITRPDDNGCWDAMDAGACVQPICDPYRSYLGWGSTRSTYTKYHRDYQTPVFCYDQLRHVEEAKAQVGAIIDGLKDLPDEINSDFLRLFSLRGADKIFVAGTALTELTVTAAMFTNNCTRINLGSSGNLPTSKLTMQYINHYLPSLGYRGYHKKQFITDSKFLMTTDIQTQQELTNANPALTNMYVSADFAKGGKYFAYGVMSAVGNILLKVDPTPLRFIALANGVLQRVWPYQNVQATVGLKSQFDPLYEQAPYQMYHVYNPSARKVFSGSTDSIHPDMKFMSRNLMGKWSWKSPDFFQAVDPTTGQLCQYQNDKKNKGYFLAEFEMGVKTMYPEIEMWILAKREQQAVADLPTVTTFANPAPLSTGQYQSLQAYNPHCDTQSTEE